ncbi:glycosyltransferase family 4 protein [Telmatocola sphagniphila]|uniref:Glycosyltransferase family 4 protein n=1 Tax=Telmatocola sphagniphila TaxID=1123043 RepID=A0A8E6BCR9_9BACT|nr:glycosyltransferase family 4 protein [Telmatocola sphagniphila]QVL34520.1 glycosyltransferase family 4 protein [Telmatocola sphagniphila]
MSFDSSKKLRVLLLAEMCNPSWTSVPLIGYNLAAALARHPHLEVTLATQIRNRIALEGDPIHRHARVEYVDTEYIAKPFHKLATLLRGGKQLAWTIDTAMMWPSYVTFEKAVRRKFAREFEQQKFDIIHRLTPVTPTLPSPLAKSVSIPMLVGPMNGGLPWPKEFKHLARQEKEWLLALRGVHKLLPYFRSTYRHLAGYIAGSRETEAKIPRHFHGKKFFISENGIDPEKFPIADKWCKPQGNFQFITVGRLAPVKGLDMIIEALASVPNELSPRLVIVGDGPERTRLERLVAEKNLQAQVRFTGWLAQADISRELRSSQAFLFPSVKDFGGGAVLEAMACGLPSIVLDYGGPAELITPATGIRLPLLKREALVPLLGQSMRLLATDHALCEQMSVAASLRITEVFTWNAKASKIYSFYKDILHVEQAKPEVVDRGLRRERKWILPSRKSVVGRSSMTASAT